jgi:hypothetical protein
MVNVRGTAKVIGTGNGSVAGKAATAEAGVGVVGSTGEAPVMAVVEVGGRGLVVSAKAVHQGLGVGRDFSSWLKSRITRYGFEAGVDFWEMGGFDSPERVNQGEASDLTPVRGKTSEGVSGFSPERGKNTPTLNELTPKRAKNTKEVARGRGSESTRNP